MFEKVLFASLILQVAQGECQDTGGSTKCASGKCDVWLNGVKYCSQCSVETEHLINGECVANDSDNNCESDTKGGCTSCKTGYFLYEGGCYTINAEPGNFVCEDQSASGTAGVCGACKAFNGFFKNPDDAAKQSCIACNRTEPLGTVKGVADCIQCSPPPGSLGTREDKVAVCSRCKDEKYLKTDGTCANDSSGCTVFTEFAKADHENGNKCILCGDKANGGVADCETCASKGTRIAETPAVKCITCSSEKAPNGDGSACVDVPGPSPSDCPVESCQNCSADKKSCEECKDKNYLTPTKMCIDRCEYITGYYSGKEGGKRVCKKCEIANCIACNEEGKCVTCKDGFYGEVCSLCDSSCKTCGGSTANDCTSCKSGTVLDYTNGQKGRCASGCAVNTDKASGNCKTCGLTMDGTRYCSACSQDDEYPQDGVCAPKASRIDKCKDGTIKNGVCDMCADGFFKMNGGCYSTGQLPGSMVCSNALGTGGTCKTPVEGFSLTGNSLVACYTGCAECTTTEDCSRCMDGYVEVGKVCTKCHESCNTCESDAVTCKICAEVGLPPAV